MRRQYRNFRPRLPLLTALLLLLLVPAGYSAAQDMLILTLASTPPDGGLRTASGTSPQSLRVVAGNTVTMQRAEGRDYRLQGGGLFWTQVQELPRNADSVTITPTLREDGGILVDIDVARKVDSRRQSFRSRLLAQPGEWLQVFGPSDAPPSGSTRYSTRGLSDESLYLMVERTR